MATRGSLEIHPNTGTLRSDAMAATGFFAVNHIIHYFRYDMATRASLEIQPNT